MRAGAKLERRLPWVKKNECQQKPGDDFQLLASLLPLFQFTSPATFAQNFTFCGQLQNRKHSFFYVSINKPFRSPRIFSSNNNRVLNGTSYALMNCDSFLEKTRLQSRTGTNRGMEERFFWTRASLWTRAGIRVGLRAAQLPSVVGRRLNTV